MHMTSLFIQFFFKTSICIFLMRDYHQTKFGLIWIEESKVTEGGGGGGVESALHVENVLNRPGEIGLKLSINLSSMNLFFSSPFLSIYLSTGMLTEKVIYSFLFFAITPIFSKLFANSFIKRWV